MKLSDIPTENWGRMGDGTTHTIFTPDHLIDSGYRITLIEYSKLTYRWNGPGMLAEGADGCWIILTLSSYRSVSSIHSSSPCFIAMGQSSYLRLLDMILSGQI